MGGEGGPQANNEKSNRRGCELSGEAVLGIHTSDSFSLEAHAWETYNAQRSETGKHIHRLGGESESWRFRPFKAAGLPNIRSFLTSGYAPIYESRGFTRQRLWLEIWCLELRMHSVWDLHAEKSIQARWQRKFVSLWLVLAHHQGTVPTYIWQVQCWVEINDHGYG